MKLAPTQDQRDFARAVADVLDKECTPAALRLAAGHSAPRWSLLAELGVLGVTVPENHGGLGLDERDLMPILVETGRVALPEALVEHVVGVRLLRDLTSPSVADELLPACAAGRTTLGVGLPREPFVVAGESTSLLLLFAGEEMHAVEANAVALTPQPALDGSRRLAHVAWSPAPGTRVAAGPAVVAAGERAADLAAFATGAQLVGLAYRLIDLAVQHAKVREQFGQPIGAFQAVKHRLADALLAVEFAAPVVARAAWSAALDVPTRSRDASMAKCFASEAADRAAHAALQVHGAIGYTDEHDVSLYLKRAWTLAAAYGDATTHRARVAKAVLDDGLDARVP